MPRIALIASLLLALISPALAQTVQSRHEGDRLILWNDQIYGYWTIQNGSFRWLSLTNNFTSAGLPVHADAFALIPKEGPVLRSSEMKIVSGPALEDLPASPTSIKAADRLPGRQIRIELEDSPATVHVTWKAILHEQANYIREEVTIRALDKPLAIAQINLVDVSDIGAEVSGQVKGSPVTTDTWFFGFEHPLSECRVHGDHASCWLSRELPLRPGENVTYSAVFGAAHRTQLRRDFLHYIELERAHPYRTFLHYNSWYDLGYFGRYNETDAVNVVNSFGEQLTKQRGVKLDSFLYDDGWDDPTTLWKFNPGFPDGLTKVAAAARQYNAAPGIWLSPWGGYSKPKEQRLASAHAQGYETNEGGLALSGPKYYAYFRDTCINMIEKYGVNQFKFDGTGNADEVIKGSQFDSDFDAAIHLIGELRAKKPDLYINLTTGTYPSPFWLLYADSIWRGGDDHSFAGVGTNRQRWITYRDSQTYRWVVEDGPLFPLNSLMLHGMIYARYAERLGVDPGNDFPDEVHDYFGTGTQLQEMYITPSLLSSHDWDVLAEAAKWSRANASTLKDTHWIGGDPAHLDVYGWAAWSPEKGIITLRNPADHAQDFSASLAQLLELPAESAKRFTAHSVWKEEREGNNITEPFTLKADEPHKFHLQPFQVLTLELLPTP
ncbi:MAG TPA: enterotoxin [Candidatus Sulfotelmatobacter sp.]|nr:enterotoxin [Candidatus Sulfotelmatobacter sp.]